MFNSGGSLNVLQYYSIFSFIVHVVYYRVFCNTIRIRDLFWVFSFSDITKLNLQCVYISVAAYCIFYFLLHQKYINQNEQIDNMPHWLVVRSSGAVTADCWYGCIIFFCFYLGPGFVACCFFMLLLLADSASAHIHLKYLDRHRQLLMAANPSLRSTRRLDVLQRWCNIVASFTAFLLLHQRYDFG